MKKSMQCVPWVLACLAWALVALGPPAFAGARFTTETRRVAPSGVKTSTAVLTAEGRQLRLDPADGDSTVIYQADGGRVWVIDHAKKSYVQVDRATTQDMSRRLQGARAELERRLGELPPEQAAAMDRLLGKRTADAAPAVPSIEVRETGGSDEIQGVACKEVEILQEGVRLAEVCAASFSDAGIPSETLDVVRELTDFLGETVNGFLKGGLQDEGMLALQSLGKLDAVPMRVRAFQDGTLRQETVVTAIERRTFPAQEFKVPAGYSPRITIDIRGTDPAAPTP